MPLIYRNLTVEASQPPYPYYQAPLTWRPYYPGLVRELRQSPRPYYQSLVLKLPQPPCPYYQDLVLEAPPRHYNEGFVREVR